MEQQQAIVIAGGSGLIGRALIRQLQGNHPKHRIIMLSRTPEKHRSDSVQTIKTLDELSGQTTLAALINLAGASVAEKRWSVERKRELIESRVNYTQSLLQSCTRLKLTPTAFINASAIGFYGVCDDNPVDETSTMGGGFAAQLCQQWEQAAQGFSQLGSRVCILRLGVVMAGQGGALSKLLPLYRFGMGGPIGSGNQWLSWVHIEDVVNVFDSCISDRRKSGVFNLTAPEPVRQKRFASELARVLNRPAFLRTPASVLSLIYGQMADELLLSGQKVRPQRLLDSGYQFLFPTLAQALPDVLHK